MEQKVEISLEEYDNLLFEIEKLQHRVKMAEAERDKAAQLAKDEVHVMGTKLRMYESMVDSLGLSDLDIFIWEKGGVRKVKSEYKDAIPRYVKMGKHFELFMNIAKENPVVGHHWEGFVSSLRLAGYDGADDEK